jgi:uncharacterized protein YkwD
MGTLVVASFIFAVFLTSPAILSTQLAAVVSSRLVSLTNDDRSDSGLGTLTVNPLLVAAAQAKANDMAAKGYFEHVSPDGRTSWSWFKDAGYSFSYAGENLAVDFTDSGNVNQAWLDSPTHRANIMNSHFTEIGIATAEGEYNGHKTTFVVQMFGTPAKTPHTVVSETQPENAHEPAIAQAEPAADVLGNSAAPAENTVATAGNEQVSEGQEGQPVVTGQEVAETSDAPSLFASPRNLLRDIYMFFGLILVLALLIRTRLEFKLHHMRHAMAVIVLIVAMGSLFIAADHFIFIPPVIGEGAAQY